MTGRTVLGAVVAVAVGAAIAAGLVMMGPPTEARNRRLDARRVADLAQIARNVDVFWSRRGNLPASLDDVAAELGLARTPADPETGAPYQYRTVDGNRYELCTNFVTETAGEPSQPAERFWVHRAGLVCFELAAETAEREPRQPAGEPGRGRGL
jgi:hypothetical protein